jgi:hypothetical protein
MWWTSWRDKFGQSGDELIPVDVSTVSYCKLISVSSETRFVSFGQKLTQHWRVIKMLPELAFTDKTDFVKSNR